MQGRMAYLKKYIYRPTMESWRTPVLTGCSCKTSHPEPLEAIYYWEKIKQGQILDQTFDKTYVCEEDQHAKPCQMPLYQVLQLE